MSGVQATLALVLLRYLRRSGKSFRLWFAKQALHIERQRSLVVDVAFHDHLARSSPWRDFWERYDLYTDILAQVERTSKFQVDCGCLLHRVLYYSMSRHAARIVWRRVPLPALNSIYTLVSAPQPPRRSKRLGENRYKKRKVQNDE